MCTEEQLLAFLATDTIDPNDPGPVVTDGPSVTLPDGRDTRAITAEWLRANVDMDAAVQMWRAPWFMPPNQIAQPWPIRLPEPGTWLFDPRDGSWEVFLVFNPHDLANSEDERAGRAHYSFPVYRAWAEAGHIPPPIQAMRHANGHLVSTNRRRLLVARDLNRPIGAWYSETSRYGGVRWALPRGRQFADTVERVQTRQRYAAQIAAWRCRSEDATARVIGS